MDPFGVVLMAVGMGALLVGFVVQQSARHGRESRRREARYRVALACGLTRIEHIHGREVSGVHGELRVRIETVRDERQATTRVSIDGVVRNVQIVRAGRGSTADLVFGDRDVQVGDPFLDADLLLQGPAASVRGLFGAYARERARAVFAMDARVRIGGGALSAEFEERGGAPAPSEWQLKELLALAHALEPGATDAARLAEIAIRDPQPSVRAMALATLAKEAPTVPRTREVLREATRDASGSIRLQAAQALGDEGRATLHALAADPAVDDAVSGDAVAALGGYMTFARATPLLERAVASLRPRTACALLGVMGRGSTAEAQIIASVLGRLSDPTGSPQAEIAQAALEALLATRAATAEDPFLAALASPRSELVLVAARGLERIGTVRAVPALRDVETGGGDLRRAARTAIAAIKSRLTGATPGQVSLAGASGEISIADSADGRVSLNPDDQPR
jgi:HEAT repeat protein